jgi:TatD DNase family protein
MDSSLNPKRHRYSIIDTHCHLDHSRFAADRDAVLNEARAAGVSAMLVPATTADSWAGVQQLCGRHADLYPALGLHPLMSDRHRDQDLQALKYQIAHNRPTAIGEIGLDFFLASCNRSRQVHLLEQQLILARQAELPVVLHVRKAHNEVLAIVKKLQPLRGIVHAFSSSLEIANAYMALGFMLGFGGMLTYERSHKLRQLASQLPLEMMVLETDAPDMVVATHRGERNQPAYLPDCLMALAEVRHAHPALVAKQTCLNACRILGMALPIEPDKSSPVLEK